MFEESLLSAVPALADVEAIESWVRETLVNLSAHYRSSNLHESFTCVKAADVLDCDPSQMNRFINGVFLADWACYAASADRVDLDRLQATIRAFPQGFRLWVCHLDGLGYLPVAYTGWYPIDAVTFEKAYDRPRTIKHRGEIWPLAHLSGNGDYIWLFNYSVVEQLRRSESSRRMLISYAEDIAMVKVLGLAAAVLSAESQGVVARFGMTYRGDVTHDGTTEMVYAKRSV